MRLIDPATGPYEYVRRALYFLAAAAMCGFAFYIAGFGVFSEVYIRGGAVGLATVIVLIADPKRSAGRAALDGAMTVAAVLAAYFFIDRYLEYEEAIYEFTTADRVYAALGLAVLLELTRRLFGWPLFIVCVVMILYILFGKDMPWIFQHKGVAVGDAIDTIWYSFDGVYGRPTAVVSQVILVFILFGAVLEATGAGQVLLKMAFAVTGRLSGGPAHAAIVASAAFGTMSGSVVGNVVGTGVFTIPMIKKRGFTPRFAGAVEAAASSGGQFMPPVMGAVAFIMADVTGIPYVTIIVAALIPALFYYGSLFCTVWVEAMRLGIGPIPVAEREKITARDWIGASMFVVPIAIIIGVLIEGRSVATAGFWATVSAVAMGLIINPEFRAKPRAWFDMILSAGRACATIMVAVGAIGIVIGAMNMTGLGIRFSNEILALSGDSLFLALLLMMAGCLILGMGMPTVPAYLIIVLVMGPAIGKLGVPILAVHLFAVYFGVLSSVTPPVAIAAFAAAPISGSSPMPTAVEAVRVSLIGFIIPFVFIAYPSMLLVLEFDWGNFIGICLRLALAIWLFATAIGGFERNRLAPWDRALRLAAAVAALIPELPVALAGSAVGLLMVGANQVRLRRAPTVHATGGANEN